MTRRMVLATLACMVTAFPAAGALTAAPTASSDLDVAELYRGGIETWKSLNGEIICGQNGFGTVTLADGAAAIAYQSFCTHEAGAYFAHGSFEEGWVLEPARVNPFGTTVATLGPSGPRAAFHFERTTTDPVSGAVTVEGVRANLPLAASV